MTVKENVKKILSLLESRSLDEIRVGWQLCAGGGTELFDALWEKLSKPFKMVSIGTVQVPQFDRDSDNTSLPGVDDYWRSIAMLGFLNAAPAGSRACMVREAYTEITVTGLVWLNQYTRQLKYDAVYLSELSNFTNLKALTVKDANGLHGLTDIYALPIETLNLCFQSGRVPLDSGFEFQQLKHLNIYVAKELDCSHLRNLSFLAKTTTLESLSVVINSEGCQLASLDGIAGNTALQELNIDAPVVDFSGLQSGKQLVRAELRNIHAVNLTGFQNSERLEGLKIKRAKNLKDLDGLTRATALKSVSLDDCPALTNVAALKNSAKLECFEYSFYSWSEQAALASLSGLENATGLQSIKLKGCMVKDLDPIRSRATFVCIKLQDLPKLQSIAGLSSAAAFKNPEQSRFIDNRVQIENCPMLKCLDGLGPGDGGAGRLSKLSLNKVGVEGLSALGGQTLDAILIDNCAKLQSLEGLHTKQSEISIQKCAVLTDIAALGACFSLKSIDLTESGALQDLSPLMDLTGLEQLITRKCNRLKPKPKTLIMDTVVKTQLHLDRFRKKNKKKEVDPEKISPHCSKLLKFFSSPEIRTVEAGLDLAASLGDPAIYDYYLEGVKVVDGTVYPGRRLLSPEQEPSADHKTAIHYAILGLISQAPPGSKFAVALSEQVNDCIDLPDAVSSLSYICGLRHAGGLNLGYRSKLTNLEGIEAMESLKVLAVESAGKLCFETFVESKSLRILRLRGANVTDLGFITKMPSLEVVLLKDCAAVRSVGTLDSMSQLKGVGFENCLSLESTIKETTINRLEYFKQVGCPKADVSTLSRGLQAVLNGQGK